MEHKHQTIETSEPHIVLARSSWPVWHRVHSVRLCFPAAVAVPQPNVVDWLPAPREVRSRRVVSLTIAVEVASAALARRRAAARRTTDCRAAQ